jgi:hypothetical protein
MAEREGFVQTIYLIIDFGDYGDFGLVIGFIALNGVLILKLFYIEVGSTGSMQRSRGVLFTTKNNVLQFF